MLRNRKGTVLIMAAGVLLLVLFAIYQQPTKQDEMSFLPTEAELGT